MGVPWGFAETAFLNRITVPWLAMKILNTIAVLQL